MFAFARSAFALLLASAALAACGPRVVHEPVFEQGRTRVLLRSQVKGEEPVARGFTHPALISSVRLGHILSRIEVRIGEGKKAKRVPAVPLQTLYEVGDGLSEGLAGAGPDQEVVVLSVRRQKRLGIFHDDFFTSFVAYVEGEALLFHFSHVDWRVPKDRAKELPEPRIDRQQMDFRVLPDRGVVPVAPQAVSVIWRDELFRETDRVWVNPDGVLERRTILLDSPEEPEPQYESPTLSDQLSPETLRRLADLEEARRRGELTEGEYQVRRREILGEDSSEP